MKQRMVDMTEHNEYSTGSPDAIVARKGCEKTPLARLVYSIIQRGDCLALRELHENRRVFRVNSGQRVLMAEFLLDLKDRHPTPQWCGRDLGVVEDAYDLTVAKFHDLPSDLQGCRPAGSDGGPDCRYYFRAFHEHITREFQQRPPESVIDSEIRAAEVLQQLVTRHFYLSCLECSRRAAKLVRRYAWKVNGSQLVLWLPIEMRGSRCRRWLQQNVPDVDPARPGERERVQALVDRLVAHRRILSLEQFREEGGCIGIEAGAEPSTWATEASVGGLAGAVAEEKAENIGDQRPVIRGLGASRLRKLIRTIFESLTEDRYHAERIAAEFALSKASFSRFAGCRWHRGSHDSTGATRIPDLWRNTAHVLASHEDFVAVARDAGVWDRVRQVILAVDSEKGAAK